MCVCVQECRRQKKKNRANKRSIHFYIGFSLELFTVNTDTKILTNEKLRLILPFHTQRFGIIREFGKMCSNASVLGYAAG